MSFKVGDRVVYPHHGAAVIEKKEKRKTPGVEGEEKEYLVLRMAHGELTLSVPSDNAETVGMRRPIAREDVGDVYQVAEVVRNLALREADRGLSAGEKSMLAKARSVLVSELSFALDVSE